MTSRFDLRRAGAAIEKQAAEIAELQAKLDKAVEALERALDLLNFDFEDISNKVDAQTAFQSSLDAWISIDNALAEIKGSKASPVKPERDE